MDALSDKLTFKDYTGRVVDVPLNKVVFNEHDCSQRGKIYRIKMMGDLETNPEMATLITQTTQEELERFKKLYPSVPVTSTSSD